MNLHFFNLPGAYPLQDIVAASKPYLVVRAQPVILYLPAAGATLNSDHVGTTQTAFESLAEVEVLDLTQSIPAVNSESIFERATVLYIPGGNTYRLLHRLYESGSFSMIQKRVKAGMPLVGFSAGIVICGQNILTSNNNNDCGSTNFTGLRFTKYNFMAHYPANDMGERE